MRVLFASTFGHGHVFPLVPLALACQDAGHDVLWATNGPAVSLVELAGIRCVETGLSGDALASTVGRLHDRAGQLAPPDRAAFMFPTMFGETLSPPMAADLLPLARSFQPDLLVHEQGELAAPLVAAVLDVPSLTHSFGGAVPAAFVADAGQRLAGLWHSHGLTQPHYAGCFQAPYLDICPPSVQTVSLSHIPTVQPLRPISWAGPSSTSGSFEPTDDARPLVYVTLGTVANNPGLLRDTLAGLACLDVQVLVTVGPTGDPDSLGPQPAHVRVERFVPQTQVLQHASVVVSHGGSGTFLGALSHGLPQVCLPQAADQFRNAAGLVLSGAGLALPPPDVSSEAIADAVSRALANPDLRGAAASVAAEISAMPSPQEVVASLPSLI
jgi:UDP:flavonoid glycosyltransferase YjiC (YdhE family)